jgi:hypothetical protein
MFGVFIAAITKSYLKLTTTFIEKIDSSNPSDQDSGTSVASVILLCIFASMPIIVFFFLLHNQYRLADSSFESMFGGLYKTLKLNRLDCYMFNVAFLVRRLIFALCIGGLLTETTLVNVMVQIFMSITLCLYIAHSKPFEEAKDNFIELMNELTILFVFYLTLGVITDDSLLTGEMRQTHGFATIGLILLNISVNFVIFLHTTLNEVIKAVKSLLKKYRKKC